MLSPLLFLALPAFAQVWAHPASHVLMAMGVVPLAATIVFLGYRRHRRTWILGAALLGIAFILAGSVLPYLPSASRPQDAAEASEPESQCAECCPTLVTNAEGTSYLLWPPAAIASIVGSGFLVAAHWGNRRACARCCNG